MKRIAANLLRLGQCLAAAVCFASGAAAESLISSLSSGRIEIASNFDGSEIVVFGSIERDGQTAGRGGYEIVVTVAGPPETIVTRRKESVFGFWINQASRRHEELPSYYTVLSSKPVEEVTTSALADRFGIGVERLVIGSDADSAPSPEDRRFYEALVRLKGSQGLFRYVPDGVAFLSPHLFRATIPLPANVPVGEYSVTVHLFSGEALLATDEKPFQISKVGFERAMYAVSRDQSLIYGIATVMIALFTGWLAGVIFRRD